MLHEKWQTPILYYSLNPDRADLIQTPYYFRLIIPSGSVTESSFIGLVKVPINNIVWKWDVTPLLSVPFTIFASSSAVHTQKISVLYPISRSFWTDFSHPKFYRLAGEHPIQLETDIVNGKLIKVNKETESGNELNNHT